MAFVVHPDVPVSAHFEGAVREAGMALLVPHASGHPWIYTDDVGGTRITGGGEISVCGGVVRVHGSAVDAVFVGHSSEVEALTGELAFLRREVARARRVEDLDGLAGFLFGSCTMLASAGGVTRSQGTVSGTGAIFRGSTAGVPIASDDPGVLRALLGGSVDTAELVLRMSNMEGHHPFTSSSIWDSVRAVPPGHWLRCADGGEATVEPWWSPPDPVSSLDALAPVLNSATGRATYRAAPPGTVVSADLSGGLDSTTLCFFLAQHRDDLRTWFLSSGKAGNTDADWSARAASELGSDHRVLPYHGSPAERLDTERHLFEAFPEGPSGATRYLDTIRRLKALSPRGAPVAHISGHGGDELFGPVTAMPWSLARSRTRGRFRTLRAFRKVNRKSLRDTLALLGTRSDPRADLIENTASDFSAAFDPYTHGARWTPLIALPEALSRDARDLARDKVLRFADEEALALHRDRTLHQILEAVRFHGTLVRRMNQISRWERRGSGVDVNFSSPFLDREIVESGLALEIGGRFSGGVKPLLARARPEKMPEDYFQRRDKGEYSPEMFAEYKEQKDRIRATFAEGSLLEDMGLIDPSAFRRQIERYTPDGNSVEQVMQIHTIERWLRSAHDADALTTTGTGGPR
ncbi:asparagine synthase [Nocardiopsis sp. HNM0947]|uniref:asparagine synthase (glutamine-hydrolyzing) n=1 Tax=Nocardiopsis coralli TaxID=2772213 RepID=A0ABR9PEN4_9ACTN|nr:asparagine synthase [Nocardiopsis coralli]MBE3002306.1 asparagine synthase [Nocardiopsis coralli]